VAYCIKYIISEVNPKYIIGITNKLNIKICLVEISLALIVYLTSGWWKHIKDANHIK